MPYDYKIEKDALFTEQGVEVLMQVRDRANKLIFMAGACTADKVIRTISGNSWTMLAALDYMEEKGEIECIHEGYRSNDAVYVKGGAKE
jgi:hypothetical protein